AAMGEGAEEDRSLERARRLVFGLVRGHCGLGLALMPPCGRGLLKGLGAQAAGAPRPAPSGRDLRSRSGGPSEVEAHLVGPRGPRCHRGEGRTRVARVGMMQRRFVSSGKAPRLLAAGLLVCLALPRTTSAAGEEILLAPHRAIYDITLGHARGGSGVSSLRGRMVYELTGSACEGYTQNMRFVTSMVNQNSGVVVTDLR